jgi:hypothetical protein
VEAKKKEKKKLDPKAKVRNRGTVCVPASSAKDKKDHFPINSESQARNALARVHQYSAAPPWYNGSLKSLQELVSRKVHSKYKGIGKSDKKKKSSLQIVLEKYATIPLPPGLKHYTLDEVAETLPVAKELYSVLWGLMPSDKDNPPYEGETPPEPDHSSRTARSLQKFWHKLTPEQQQNIVDAKAQDEAEMQKYRTPQSTQPIEEPENTAVNPFEYETETQRHYRLRDEEAQQLGNTTNYDLDEAIRKDQKKSFWEVGENLLSKYAQTAIPEVNVEDLPQAPVPVESLPKAPKYPPISPDVQRALNQALHLNLRPDGQMGPDTQAALEQFKAKYSKVYNLIG